MNSPINVTLAMFAIVVAAGAAVLWQSPEALYIFARKMRARARALEVSRRAYMTAYSVSINDDIEHDRQMEEERTELDRIFKLEVK